MFFFRTPWGLEEVNKARLHCTAKEFPDRYLSTSSIDTYVDALSRISQIARIAVERHVTVYRSVNLQNVSCSWVVGFCGLVVIVCWGAFSSHVRVLTDAYKKVNRHTSYFYNFHYRWTGRAQEHEEWKKMTRKPGPTNVLPRNKDRWRSGIDVKATTWTTIWLPTSISKVGYSIACLILCVRWMIRKTSFTLATMVGVYFLPENVSILYTSSPLT